MVEDNLPLFGLIAWLKAMNGPNAEFWITNTLHERLGWSETMPVQARQDALDGGWIVQITRPSPGRPPSTDGVRPAEWNPARRGEKEREGQLRIAPRNRGP
jgi:hypothetical protein